MSGHLEQENRDRSAELQRIWKLCLAMVSSRVTEVTNTGFLLFAVPLKYENNIFELGVASTFARDWVMRRASNAIRSALEFHMDVQGLELKIVVLKSGQSQRSTPVDTGQEVLPLELETAAPVVKPSPEPSAPVPGRTGGRASKSNSTGIKVNPRFSFDTFMVGASNRLACTAARKVAENPRRDYNPLFIYGPHGMGKTHLLHAIVGEVQRRHPNMRVNYTTAELFTHQFVTAIKEHSTEAFRAKHRDIDFWLVDDIKFFAGKKHTCDEFINTFKMLQQQGSQVVLTGDSRPRDLNTLDAGLYSAIQGGLIADIGAPEMETRLAILRTHRDLDGFVVSDDVLEYIANAIQSNFRALQGALTRLIAYSSIMQAEPTVDLARKILTEYFIELPNPVLNVTPMDVTRAVSHKLGATVDAILGPSRIKDVSIQRQIAMYVCKEIVPQINATAIGTFFGGRDHATVAYAFRKVQTMMQMDEELAASIQDVIMELRTRT